MAKVIYTVEFTVEIPDPQTDLDAVTFDLVPDLVTPCDQDNKPCGRLLGYCTQQDYEIVPEK